MSRQSEAKTRQGYVPKAEPATCMNCTHFAYDMDWYDEAKQYPREVNLCCTLGDFAVKNMATCNLFERKIGGGK